MTALFLSNEEFHCKGYSVENCAKVCPGSSPCYGPSVQDSNLMKMNTSNNVKDKNLKGEFLKERGLEKEGSLPWKINVLAEFCESVCACTVTLK